MQVDGVAKRISDKILIDSIYERDIVARQMQLVTDWLEQNERDDMEFERYCEKIEFQGPHCWENTLHHLKIKTKSPLSHDNLCLEMDFDAPIRSELSLHDLDKDDENRLMRHILRYMRAGKLDTAIEIAEKLGYHWLSGALYGWVPFHDPSFQENQDVPFLITNGNASRDLWKYASFKFSQMDDKNKSQLEAAVFGILCGNLKPALPFLNRWSDKLWLYTRASLDCLIEQELCRSSSPNIVTARGSTPLVNLSRSSVELPPEYWQNTRNFDDIFRQIEVFEKGKLLSEEENCHYNVQKFIILGDIDGLLQFMVDWARGTPRTEELRPHHLRFFSHVALFLMEVDLLSNESQKNFLTTILEEYLSYLIEWREIELVVSYVPHLPPSQQVDAYAKLLTNVTDPRQRQLAFRYAKEAKLDIETITKTVVETMREVDTGQDCQLNPAAEISEADMIKINSLDWLLIDEINHLELLLQSNALIRHFLLSSKIESAKLTMRKLPSNIVDRVTKDHRKKVKHSPLLTGVVQEHLHYIYYLEALREFDVWVEYFTKSKPKKPETGNLHRFTDKVAFQHSLKQHDSDMVQWKHSLTVIAESVRDRIERVLCPPEGCWLACSSAKEIDLTRKEQMLRLRKEKVPPLVFMLHKTLHESELWTDCLRIANLLASETHCLYKEFSRDELIVCLTKLRETSIRALDRGLCCCI